jgi:inorganic triphosphatase YgiF
MTFEGRLDGRQRLGPGRALAYGHPGWIAHVQTSAAFISNRTSTCSSLSSTRSEQQPTAQYRNGRLPKDAEVELKLAVPAAELEKLESVLKASPTVRSEVQPDLISTYYDTPDLTLHRRGLTLRVRKQGPKLVQTVKAADSAEANVLGRREWEEPIAARRPVLDAPKTGKRLRSVIDEKDLQPVFTTVITRRLIEIEPHPRTRIEAAIDEGAVCTTDGGAIEPIREIELELKSGDPAMLYDVALRLLGVAPIRIETQSKAERGYRLSAGVKPHAVHVGPVALDRDMSVEDALERFGQRCLAQVLKNEAAVLAGEPEAIHQMRVGVRRLRSVLSALKPMLPAEQYHWASDELKWFGHALGPARNWDIFVTSLIRPVDEALPGRQELSLFAAAAEHCRRAAFEVAKKAILSKRYTLSTLRLLQWFTARAWRDQPVSDDAALLLAPIVSVAPDLIESCHRKALHRCKRFEMLSAAERHKLRIALKKLRYLIEFLGSLFDKHEVEAFVHQLKQLQDDLGHANDVRVADQLLGQIPSDCDLRTIDRAGGIVLGWHERDLADREPKLRKDVRRFKRLQPFW